MATLSTVDKQNLSAEQQAAVLALKEQYETAKANGATQPELDKIHADAEEIRQNAASGVSYSGGKAGNAYENPVQRNTGNTSATTNAYATNVYATGNNSGNNSGNSSNTKLSQADSALLNAEQQAQIAELKKQYETAKAAGASQPELDSIHALAEQIRNSAGYTTGLSGADADFRRVDALSGGMTADQMKQWLEDYMYTNYNNKRGWINGYSTAMNSRSKANIIRQQMEANDLARANTTDQGKKDYLHQQNLALAQLLYDYTGQSEKNTYYNDELGRWETWNSNVGYGYDMNGTQPNIYNSWKQYYGYTDDMIENWANDTSHYYNFVDTRVPQRDKVDESSGYTGQYAQFVNGPYIQLLRGSSPSITNPSIYQDMPNDGFMDGVYDIGAPELKGNNAMTDYTNQFTSYVQGGIIQPGILAAAQPGGGSHHGGVQKGSNNGTYSHSPGYGVDGSDPRYTGGINRDVAASTPEDPNNIAGQLAYYENYGKYGNAYGSGGGTSMPSAGGGGYDDYINQMYAAALESQMAQLESSYKENLSGLDTAAGKVDDTYTEQKRQTTGTNAQQAAAWREMANAYGLNSGAIGQAALAQNNQLQSNLNTLESAQAAALTEIEQQRNLLGQQYQLAINQALAENNFNKADALYQEAVRQDELMLQKQQMAIQTALQVAQMAMQQSQFEQGLALDYAKAAGSASRSGGGSGGAGTPATTHTTDDFYKAALESGDPEIFLQRTDMLKKYGLTGVDDEILAEKYYDWVGTDTQKANSQILNQNLQNLHAMHGLSNSDRLNLIEGAYNQGTISKQQRDALFDEYGL